MFAEEYFLELQILFGCFPSTLCKTTQCSCLLLLFFLVSCLFQQCVCQRIFSRTAEVVWSFPQHMMQNNSMLFFLLLFFLVSCLFQQCVCRRIFSRTAEVVWSFPQHIMLFLRTSYRKQLNALNAHSMCRKYFPHFKLQQTVHRIYSNLLAMSKRLFWSITSVEQQEFFFILDSLKNKSLYNILWSTTSVEQEGLFLILDSLKTSRCIIPKQLFSSSPVS